MADDDSIKKLEARLTRLEAALAQQPSATVGAPPGGAVVDPAPYPGGGGGWGYPRWPHPVVDPGPWWWGHHHWPPSPVVDPAPHPIVDPAVFAQRSAAAAFGRIGHVGGDPPPPDISRFSIAQLEASLHSINAEKARLDSMGTMITQQLEKMKKQG